MAYTKAQNSWDVQRKSVNAPSSYIRGKWSLYTLTDGLQKVVDGYMLSDWCSYVTVTNRETTANSDDDNSWINSDGYDAIYHMVSTNTPSFSITVQQYDADISRADTPSDIYDSIHPYIFNDNPVYHTYNITNDPATSYSREFYHFPADVCPLCPVFHESDSQAIQNYIDSGDDSGAINYDVLHSPSADYHVFIDGTNTPIIQIRLEDSSDYTSSNVEISGITSFDFESEKDLQWNDLKTLANDPLLSSVQLFIYPHTNNEGVSYVADAYVGVTIGSDGTYTIERATSTNGKNTLTVTQGEATESGGDDSNNDSFSNVDNATTISGANVLTKTYLMSTTRLKDFGNFLFSDSFVDNIKLANSNPIDNVLSIKGMPCLCEVGDDETIVVGNVNSGVNGKPVSNPEVYSVNVGDAYIGRIFKNFLDYEMIDIKIFLPFIGFKQLDAKVVVGKTINVKYIFDVIRGKCLAILSLKVNNNLVNIDCFEGCCGVDINITASNQAQYDIGHVANIIDSVSSYASGNITGVINGVENALLQPFKTENTGVGTSNLMSAMTRDCYLIITRPNDFKLPNNYKSIYGFPCYKQGKVRDFKGFIQCQNYRVNGFNFITQTESEKLETLMNRGVYINEQ